VLDGKEHAAQIDAQTILPVLQRDVLDRSSRPGNPDIVDKNGEVADRGGGLLENLTNRFVIAHVTECARHSGIGGERSLERDLPDVADMDPVAASQTALGDRSSDAVCAAGYEDGFCHGIFLRFD
jgi:hypothetical protein